MFEPSLVDEREDFALSVNGVTEALPIVIGFANGDYGGRTTPVLLSAPDTRAGGLHPPDLVEGSLADLAVPGAVAIDQSL